MNLSSVSTIFPPVENRWKTGGISTSTHRIQYGGSGRILPPAEWTVFCSWDLAFTWLGAVLSRVLPELSQGAGEASGEKA